MAALWHPDDELPELVTDVVHWRVRPDAPAPAIPPREVREALPE